MQDNNDLRISFYVLLPSNIQGGAVISAATLLQVVNISKSKLEALLGAPINEIKLGYVATSTTPTGNATTPSVTQPSQTIPAPTDKEENDNDWKWIVIGVVLGALVIVIITVIVVM